jgi:hypothetical protein
MLDLSITIFAIVPRPLPAVIACHYWENDRNESSWTDHVRLATLD